MSLFSSIDLEVNLEKLAKGFSDYLLPAVCVFGADADFIHRLSKRFVVKDKYQHDNNYDAFIFIGNVPSIQDQIESLDVNLKNKATLFLVTDETDIPQKPLSSENFALWIRNASVDNVIWHILAIRVLQETLIHNNAYYPILSTNKEYRDTVNKVLNHVAKKKPLVINIDSIHHAKALISFLFDDAPTTFSPIECEGDHLPSGFINANRNKYRIIYEKNYSSTRDILEKIPNDCPYIVFTHEIPTKLKINTFDISGFNERPNDIHLLNYYVLLKECVSLNNLRYLKETSLFLQKESSVQHPIKSISELLAEPQSCQLVPNKGLIDVVETSSMLSLKFIMDHLERKTMSHMREKAPSVECAIHASGFSTATWHRKLRNSS